MSTKLFASSPRLFVLLLLLVLPAACAKKAATPAPGEGDTPEVAMPAGGESMLQNEAEKSRVEGEYSRVMYARRLRDARQYLRAGQLKLAETAIADALRFDPSSQEAFDLQAQIQRALGRRGGEATTLLDDADAGEKIRREEQKVVIKAALARAAQDMEAHKWAAAKRNYENALFTVNSAPPSLKDRELEGLGDRAREGLSELRRKRSAEDRERAIKEHQEALRRITRQQETQLLESQQRRAKLLEAAVDKFNLEEFAAAENYARQVIAEEPDNRLAQDIVKNSRRAQHTFVNESLLRDMKQGFRDWWTDIARTKVPQGGILRWPSQKFWDDITRVRARRAAVLGGKRLSVEEQSVLNQLRTRTVDLRFEATPFPDVVNYLTAATGQNFVIDARARDDLSAAEITITVDRVSVEDGLRLLMEQASPEGEVVYEIVGNVVRFIKTENQARNLVLEIHPVADLVMGLTDFIPGQITLVGVDESSEEPLFDSEAEEVPLPYGTIEELMELVRSSVATPESWDEGGASMNPQGDNLVVFNTPEIQGQVRGFLDDLRSFSGIVVTVESRFLAMSDAFLRDVGVDFRGLGGTNGGPLAVLDDVTSGLDDNASAALDNSGPGLPAGAALAPSSGFFFNDGADGDFRGRTENIYTTALGQMLSALGGGSFQATYIDDLSMSVILRLTEKSQRIRELTAPSLTVFNTQRANLTVVNQISFIRFKMGVICF